MYLMVVRDQDRLFALCQLLLPVIKYSKNLIQNYMPKLVIEWVTVLAFEKFTLSPRAC